MNNKKQSYVDLSRKGGVPLINHDTGEEDEDRKGGSQPDDKKRISNETAVPGSPYRPMPELVDSSAEGTACRTSASWLSGSSSEGHTDMRDDVAANETLGMSATSSSTLTTRGQGGMPLSPRSDREALVGRMGRQETCVINAATMASSWPHKSSGGKKYNKPIVVDLDLPVWDNESAEV